jgi:DNA-binding NarL/FixJ family response regulator
MEPVSDIVYPAGCTKKERSLLDALYAWYLVSEFDTQEQANAALLKIVNEYAGISRRPQGRPRKPAALDRQARALRDEGLTLRAIAERLQVSQRTVVNMLRISD